MRQPYLVIDDEQEQIMRDVVFLRPEGDKILLATLLREQKNVQRMGMLLSTLLSVTL